jgi:hypothetical protein
MKAALKPKGKPGVLKLKALRSKAEKPTMARAKRPAASALGVVDALLDEALSETFPASDPVALTQPSRRRRAALKSRARRRV